MLSRTLAAACVAAALLAAPATAAELKPFQKDALEILLKSVPKEHQAMARAQFEQMLAPMSEMQVAMMVEAAKQAMAEDAAEEAEEDIGAHGDEAYEATPEDLAFNAAQYEPVLRKLWEEGRACDMATEEAMVNHMSGRTFAVWGQAWRYELMELKLNNAQSTPADYEQFAFTYRSMAPTDGRYRFDLSRVKTSCDATAIDTAVAAAHADYEKLGAQFLADIKPLTDAEDFEGAFALERKVNAKVSLIVRKLEQAIAGHRPNGSDALIQALMSGERIG